MANQSAAEDLRDFAAANGLGTVDVNLFADVEPDDSVTVDPVATFHKYGDEPEVMIYESRTPALDAPRVQVVARSRNADDAKALGKKLQDLLYQSNTTLGQGYYTMVRPMGAPQYIGPDANNREQFSINVRTQRYY